MFSWIVSIAIAILLVFTAKNSALANLKMHHTPLPEQLKHDLIYHNAWDTSCPVSLDRLRLLHITYVDFAGNEQHDGQLIVLDAVADNVLEIFKELYAQRFPIAGMKPISFYQGSDDLSMEANNSTSFHCRNITNGKAISIHSYGLAIDVNPVQNPYVSFEVANKGSTATISPWQGCEYVNRSIERPGMVEPIVEVFKKWGFPIWGGNFYHDLIDWHHFQPTRAVAEILSWMSPEHAKEFFALWTKSYESLLKLKPGAELEPLKQSYQQNPEEFMERIRLTP